jgi:hypothetical protein
MAAVVTTIGIYVICRFEHRGREYTIYFICYRGLKANIKNTAFLHWGRRCSRPGDCPFQGLGRLRVKQRIEWHAR